MSESAVKIRGYYRYDSGEPYRVWTLTRDVPELLLGHGWQEDVGGPPHAAAGDELWEDKDDRSEYFRLKRDDYVVARPEWWQVGPLFGGVRPTWKRKRSQPRATAAAGVLESIECTKGGKTYPAWCFLHAIHLDEFTIPQGATMAPFSSECRDLKGVKGEYSVWPDGFEGKQPFYGITAHTATELKRIDEISRVSEYRAALRAIGAPVPAKGRWLSSFAFVESDVGNLARRGDVLVHASEVAWRPNLNGRIRELAISDFELFAARARKDARLLKNITPGVQGWNYGLRTVYEFLCNKNTWGMRLKQWYSRLLLVRPVYREPISAPICAASDEHAIFELLSECGGRMPAR